MTIIQRKRHRAGAADLFHLRHQPLGRPDADLGVDVDLHAQMALGVLQLDVERHAPVALVLRKHVPQLFERRAVVRRRRQPDGDRSRQPLAHDLDRRDLRRQQPRRLVVALELPFDEHHLAVLGEVSVLLERLRKHHDLEAARRRRRA